MQLSTAQQAMLERERQKNEGADEGRSGGRPIQLSTAQQVMLNKEKQRKEAAEAAAAAEAHAGEAARDAMEEPQEDQEAPDEELEDEYAGTMVSLQDVLRNDPFPAAAFSFASGMALSSMCIHVHLIVCWMSLAKYERQHYSVSVECVCAEADGERCVYRGGEEAG